MRSRLQGTSKIQESTKKKSCALNTSCISESIWGLGEVRPLLHRRRDRVSVLHGLELLERRLVGGEALRLYHPVYSSALSPPARRARRPSFNFAPKTSSKLSSAPKHWASRSANCPGVAKVCSHTGFSATPKMSPRKTSSAAVPLPSRSKVWSTTPPPTAVKPKTASMARGP